MERTPEKITKVMRNKGVPIPSIGYDNQTNRDAEGGTNPDSTGHSEPSVSHEYPVGNNSNSPGPPHHQDTLSDKFLRRERIATGKAMSSHESSPV